MHVFSTSHTSSLWIPDELVELQLDSHRERVFKNPLRQLAWRKGRSTCNLRIRRLLMDW